MSGDVAQVVRVLACHAKCRGFESRLPRIFVFVFVFELGSSSMVEQRSPKPSVMGSTPIFPGYRKSV
jgi:hypothetical protein